MTIYCDHNASTPLRPEVLEAMLPFLRGPGANASSVHALGSHSRCAVEEARAQVAALIGAAPAEVVFTSGGTESNNLAIFGATPPSWAIVTTPIEHASVREPVAALAAAGHTVRTVAVDGAGRVQVESLIRHLEAAPAMASIGWANNEIGTIQPMADVVAACRERGAVLHVDAVQAAGKIRVQVLGIDLLSLSAHKLGGPQGIGALFVRRGLALRPMLLGGGQERGRRAGTENVAAIVGFGEACRLAGAELDRGAAHCAALRDRVWHGLQAAIPGVHRNGPTGADCLPNTLNVRFDDVRGEALVAALDLEGVAVSSGSACAAGAGEPSHVLMAIGQSSDTARDGVRFSLGRANTMIEIERVISVSTASVARIRAAKGQAAA